MTCEFMYQIDGSGGSALQIFGIWSPEWHCNAMERQVAYHQAKYVGVP